MKCSSKQIDILNNQYSVYYKRFLATLYVIVGIFVGLVLSLTKEWIIFTVLFLCVLLMLTFFFVACMYGTKINDSEKNSQEEGTTNSPDENLRVLSDEDKKLIERVKKIPEWKKDLIRQCLIQE